MSESGRRRRWDQIGASGVPVASAFGRVYGFRVLGFRALGLFSLPLGFRV